MSKNTIEKIFGANVFIDGDEFIGRANEVTLPNVNIAMSDHQPLGYFGTVRLFNGIENMELSVTWSSIVPEVLKRGPHQSLNLTIRAAQHQYAQGVLSEAQPVVVFARGRVLGKELGTITGNDGGSRTTTFVLDYLRVLVDGEELYEVDILNRILRFDGEDIYADTRSALGME